MNHPPAPGIEKFAHWLLTLENPADRPRVKRFPCSDHRELLAFYGLEANPFSERGSSASPPDDPQSEPVYRRMRQGVEDGISLGSLTAPRGMGTASLIRRLAESLVRDGYTLVDLRIEERLTGEAFLKRILRGLGFTDVYKWNLSPHDLMRVLGLSLVTRHYHGDRRVILLLTEAQSFSGENLTLVKLISDIGPPRSKSVTVLLFGDERLDEALRRKEHAPLFGRIFLREKLRPLTAADTARYLQRKLDRVNFKSPLFHDQVYESIFSATGGICREIDNVAHNALVSAYRLGKKTIDPEVMRALPAGETCP